MVTVDLGEEVAMNRSPSSLDPLRPLSPADLRSGGAVPAGTALICAEAAIAGRAEPVAGTLLRHGWASPGAAQPDRARWLASVRQLHVVVILGQTPHWSAQAIVTIRAVTTAPILVLAEFGYEAHPRLFESGGGIGSARG